jgi:predicted anti-sigma-YlaC factor YlaD
MNCKKARELIMTDYSDGELSRALTKKIERHLLICSECRQLTLELRKRAIEPFKKAEEVKPSDSVWYQIREAIASGESQQPEGFLAYLRDIWRGAYYLPRPVYATAAVMVIILAVTVFARQPLTKQKLVNQYLKEEMEFLVNLRSEPKKNSSDTLATKIEMSFL